MAIGVCLHLPMYVMAAPMHFRLAGVAVDLPMKIGMRGTGSGTVAAGSKAGGILGAMLGVAGLFDSFLDW